MSTVGEFDLFRDFEERWTGWPLDERCVAAYGIATNVIHMLRRRKRPLREAVITALWGCEQIRAAMAAVLGKTEAEMDVLCTELWKRRGAPEALN